MMSINESQVPSYGLVEPARRVVSESSAVDCSSVPTDTFVVNTTTPPTQTTQPRISLDDADTTHVGELNDSRTTTTDDDYTMDTRSSCATQSPVDRDPTPEPTITTSSTATMPVPLALFIRPLMIPPTTNELQTNLPHSVESTPTSQPSIRAFHRHISVSGFTNQQGSNSGGVSALASPMLATRRITRPIQSAVPTVVPPSSSGITPEAVEASPISSPLIFTRKLSGPIITLSTTSSPSPPLPSSSATTAIAAPSDSSIFSEPMNFLTLPSRGRPSDPSIDLSRISPLNLPARRMGLEEEMGIIVPVPRLSLIQTRGNSDSSSPSSSPNKSSSSSTRTPFNLAPLLSQFHNNSPLSLARALSDANDLSILRAQRTHFTQEVARAATAASRSTLLTPPRTPFMHPRTRVLAKRIREERSRTGGGDSSPSSRSQSQSKKSHSGAVSNLCLSADVAVGSAVGTTPLPLHPSPANKIGGLVVAAPQPLSLTWLEQYEELYQLFLCDLAQFASYLRELIIKGTFHADDITSAFVTSTTASIDFVLPPSPPIFNAAEHPSSQHNIVAVLPIASQPSPPPSASASHPQLLLLQALFNSPSSQLLTESKLLVKVLEFAQQFVKRSPPARRRSITPILNENPFTSAFHQEGQHEYNFNAPFFPEFTPEQLSDWRSSLSLELTIATWSEEEWINGTKSHEGAVNIVSNSMLSICEKIQNVYLSMEELLKLNEEESEADKQQITNLPSSQIDATSLAQFVDDLIFIQAEFTALFHVFPLLETQQELTRKQTTAAQNPSASSSPVVIHPMDRTVETRSPPPLTVEIDDVLPSVASSPPTSRSVSSSIAVETIAAKSSPMPFVMPPPLSHEAIAALVKVLNAKAPSLSIHFDPSHHANLTKPSPSPSPSHSTLMLSHQHQQLLSPSSSTTTSSPSLMGDAVASRTLPPMNLSNLGGSIGHSPSPDLRFNFESERIRGGLSPSSSPSHGHLAASSASSRRKSPPVIVTVTQQPPAVVKPIKKRSKFTQFLLELCSCGVLTPGHDGEELTIRDGPVVRDLESPLSVSGEPLSHHHHHHHSRGGHRHRSPHRHHLTRGSSQPKVSYVSTASTKVYQSTGSQGSSS